MLFLEHTDVVSVITTSWKRRFFLFSLSESSYLICAGTSSSFRNTESEIRLSVFIRITSLVLLYPVGLKPVNHNLFEE